MQTQVLFPGQYVWQWPNSMLRQGLIKDVDTFWTRQKQTIQAKYMHVRELEQARTRKKNLTADGTDPGEDEVQVKLSRFELARKLW